MSDNHLVVSIIVPARNEEANLAACLTPLVSQTDIAYEIIVVDDDSTDRTAEIARSFVNGQNAAIRAQEAGSSTSRDDLLASHPSALGMTMNGTGGASGVPGMTMNGTGGASAVPGMTMNGTGGASAVPGMTMNGTGGASAVLGMTTNGKGTASAVPQMMPLDGGGFSPCVTVVSAPPLPANWTGKNNAMSAGAKLAKGNWLLFTDADTVHAPGSLARAVAEAEQHGAALLSYSPAQEVHGFWEKAVMPVIFAELATTYPPQAVNDPASPIAAANGQYLMISREAYDAVGGHTKISADLLEDVALARLVKRSGRKTFFRYGGDAVRTRMYRSFAQLREGWAKNLALLFPRPRTLAFLRMAEFLLIVGNLSAAIWAKLSGHPNLALQTALLTIILGGWFAMRIRKAHFPLASNFVAILGLPVFSYLLVKSLRLRNAGVIWKGRTYQGEAAWANGRSNNSRNTGSGQMRATERAIQGSRR